MITGANGYLGSKLTKYFSNLNYDLLCVFNKKINKKINKKNVKYIKHNLLKRIPTDKINPNFDAVLHFAGPKNDRSYVNSNNKKILEGNTIDKNTIQFCKENKIKLFIYASSSAVYDLEEGIVKKKSPFKEENVKINTSYDGAYGYSKKLTENYLKKIQSKNFRAVSCRIFSIYGNDSKTIINNWKDQTIKGKTINIWGDNIVRSWLHIDDFLSAINIILNNNKRFKVINIGSSERTSLEDIAEIIKKKTRKNSKVKIIYSNYPGPKVRYANQYKLKKLGWKQRISLSDGIDLI